MLVGPEAGLDLRAGLEDDSEHDEAVEADAGGADVLQALDVPDQGERQGRGGVGNCLFSEK